MMGAVIGDVLPLALGIAISPIPIIAAILMLLSPHARSTSVGFLLGWVLGIVVAVSVFVLLSALLPEEDPDAARPIRGVVQLLFGVLLLLLAVRQWSGRPQGDEAAALPKWMQAIDGFTFAKALSLGFLLAAANPKNLAMSAAAGVAIGGETLAIGAVLTVIGVFTVLAAVTIAGPVVAYLFASGRLREPLDGLRRWLEKENAVIMSVLLLVIGVALIGKGIASF